MSQLLIETLPAKPTPKIDEAIGCNSSGHGFGSVRPILAMATPLDPAPLYVFGDSLSDIGNVFPGRVVFQQSRGLYDAGVAEVLHGEGSTMAMNPIQFQRAMSFVSLLEFAQRYGRQ